jgi:hypothetical protein
MLVANRQYRVAMVCNASGYYISNPPAVWKPTGVINWLGACYGSGASVVYPSGGGTTNTIYGTADIGYNQGPSIYASTSSLNLGTTPQGTPGSTLNYTVSGYQTTAGMNITAPTNVEVKLATSGTWGDTAFVPNTGTWGPVTINARIKGNATGGTVSGNILHTSTGLNPVNIAVNGTVTGPTILTSTTSMNLGNTAVGYQTTPQSYTVSGSILPGQTTINAPANVVISFSQSSGYLSQLTVAQTGTWGPTTIWVKIPDTAPSGAVSGNITHTSSQATQVNIAITGFVFPPPASLPFTDDFSTDKGWQLASPWQRAAAQAFTQASPAQSQPGTDYTPSSSDNMILGDTIGSPYKYAINNSQEYWATSPPFSGTGHTNIRLRFWAWLGLAIGATAKVEATNNGSTWVNIWTSTSGTTYGGNATATWTSMTYDLTSVCAGNAVCQFRIGIGPTGANASTGWSIDDLEVEEPGYDMQVNENSAGGTQIYDDDAVGGARDFGQIAVSTNSTPLDIFFTNNGPTPINFGTYIKTGANPLDFYVNSSVFYQQNPLPVGQTTSLRIVFNRSTVGVSTATIELPHNAAFSGTTPFEINLRGEAIVQAPVIRVNLGSASGPVITHQQSPAGTPRDFGNQDIGAGPTSPITIFITNSGTGTLSLTAPYRQGTYWSEYQLNTIGFASNLTAGQSTSFEITFDPTAIGSKDAEIHVQHTSTSQTNPFIIPVIGNGTSSSGPTVEVHEGTATGPTLAHADPAGGARDFGNVLVGNTSAPCTITIKNAGGATMTLGTPALGGTNPGEFTLSTAGFSPSVAAGADTSFQVRFAPTAVGVKLAQVTFTHNDTGATSPFVVNFRGNGVTTVAAIEVRETSSTGAVLANPAPATGILNFGNQDVNSGPTTAATIYVENTGTAALTLGIPSFQSPTTEFQLQTTGFAGSVAPGSSATFGITFDPSSAATHTAVVQFTHNDTTAGTPFVLNLTGDGTLNAPIIEVREGTTIGPLIASGASAVGTGRDCGTIDVAFGNTFPSIIVIMNTGNQTLNLGTPTLTGVNSADFILSLGGMSTTVAAGGSTQFSVSFDPVLAGMKDCQVEFSQDDPGNADPYILRFVGTGTDPNAVQIDTPDLPGAIPSVQYGPLALSASQGTTPYVWSIYSGNLPAGLNLSAGGIISGTPSGFGGIYQVTIRVADPSGATNEKTYTVVLSGDLSGRGKAESGCAASDSGSNLTLLLLSVLGAMVCGIRVARRRA